MRETTFSVNADVSTTSTQSKYIDHRRYEQKDHSLKQRSIWKMLYILWIILIILSQVPFIAEEYVNTSVMDETYQYNLSFDTDGRTGHYYIERYDTTKDAKINVIYTTISNTLEVDCSNIKVLKIYCRDMYNDKAKEVLKQDPKLDSNYYKTYFINLDHFHVHVYTEKLITELDFYDTPTPYNVTVNGQEWWLSKINYTYKNNGIVFTKVPEGHSYVDIYFKSTSKNAPVALFITNKLIVGVNESITLNASSSYDPNGQIENYIWDLGEGTFKIGVVTQHSYKKAGKYKILLTIRDNEHMLSRASQNITVVNRIMGLTKSVDKPITTPGTILTYKIKPSINTSWQDGVKDIVVTDILPGGLEYVDAKPLPELNENILTWKLGNAFDNDQIITITLEAAVKENVVNSTIITNYAILDYKGFNNQQFPQEISNAVATKVNVGTILAPRIIEPVSDITLLEDDPPFHLFLTQYEYDLQDFGTDLKWYITNENESMYIVSGELSDNDVITITPLPNAHGNSLVTLWLVDTEGYTASQDLWINITSVNDNPVFSSAPDLIIHYGDPYTFDYESYIFDLDTPKEQLTLLTSEKIGSLDDSKQSDNADTKIENGNHIKVDGFKVTYTFPESMVGEQVLVSLIIFDGTNSDGDTIQINVTDDYTPKLKMNLPDVVLDEGETKFNLFDLDDYFEDPDGDSLFFTLGETHVEVVINENHSVDIIAPSDWFGLDTVTFRAKDPIGALAEDTIFVTVNPINDPPVIDGAPKMFIVHYDEDYIFDLTPYIFDEDNPLNELSLILTDEYIRTDPINNLKIIINYPLEMVGMEIPVTILVTDGFATGAHTIIVKVTSNWPPEIRKKLPDISIYEDQVLLNAFNLNNYFEDKDSNALYYTFGQKHIQITINSNHSVDFSAEKDWYGVEIVTFRATDPTNAFVENVIIVTVTPVNDPPIIKPIPAQIIKVKQILKIDLTEFINDVDNNITELTITADSEKLDVIISGRKIVIYSNKPIVDIIKITVNDGQEEVTDTLLIQIRDDKPEKKESVNFLLSILWILILIIIIIASITGYAGFRRYYGDYNIEEIFWISDSGLLISHIKPKSTKRKADNEIVSGMLTAILDFSEDAFTEVGTEKNSCRIKEIQMDEKNILVKRGYYTFLATVFTGSSGKRLYTKSTKVMNLLENKYKNTLRDWSGDVNDLLGGELLIKSILIPNPTKVSSNPVTDTKPKLKSNQKKESKEKN